MAAIDNAEAIRFCNEQIRPICETLRNLEPVLQDIQGQWFGGGLSSHFGTGGDTVEDGREGQGVSRLTAADITNVLTQVGTIVTQFAGGGVMDVIRKPCVRPMRVGGE